MVNKLYEICFGMVREVRGKKLINNHFVAICKISLFYFNYFRNTYPKYDSSGVEFIC